MAADKQKEPILTALLNFFTGGGGYLYIGQTVKGIVFIGGALLVTIIVLVLMIGTSAMGLGFSLAGACGTCWPIPLWILITIATAIDGHRLTQRLNEGHSLGKWEFTLRRK